MAMNQSLASDRDSGFWRKLKRHTSGLVTVEAYAEYYRVARERSRGDIIDIGCGRGGSAISFALGIRDSGRNAKVHAIDIFRQKDAEGPHRYGEAEYPENCVQMNVGEVRQNARDFDVEDVLALWPGAAEAVAPTLPRKQPIDVVAIDVDGHIDRELRAFYDMVEFGGLIIFDDYGDFVDKRGRAHIGAMKGKTKAEIREWLNSIGRQSALRAMGKDILTYRLANRLEAMGAISKINVVEYTAFFVKSSHRPFESFDLSELERAGDSVLEDFVHACS